MRYRPIYILRITSSSYEDKGTYTFEFAKSNSTCQFYHLSIHGIPTGFPLPMVFPRHPRYEYYKFMETLDPVQVPYLISQEIAACVLELITLECEERNYLAMLERKAELESRIAYLQRMEERDFSPRP